jgi:AcrR family transcriptional regulator
MSTIYGIERFMVKKTVATAGESQSEVREKILETACTLFYRNGVRAVGVDLIIEKAGVAKTSLYRHFGTKDDLIAAFLAREDADFWETWDRVSALHAGNAVGELHAQLEWIAERVARPNYRGCPQLNVAAEFAEADHPARKVAATHKEEMHRRLAEIGRKLKVRRPGQLASQLSLLINGAFVSSQIIKPQEAKSLLHDTARVLVQANK